MPYSSLVTSYSIPKPSPSKHAEVKNPDPEDPALLQSLSGWQDEASALFSGPYLKDNSTGLHRDPIF
jgi:hypothetical protein